MNMHWMKSSLDCSSVYFVLFHWSFCWISLDSNICIMANTCHMLATKILNHHWAALRFTWNALEYFMLNQLKMVYSSYIISGKEDTFYRWHCLTAYVIMGNTVYIWIGGGTNSSIQQLGYMWSPSFFSCSFIY